MTSEKRPVYILGAGFSKAINSDMPTSYELGEKLKKEMPHLADKFGRERSFEHYLSMLTTPLPFLSRIELLERQAEAAKITSLIALMLEELSEEVSSQKLPTWLIDLVRIWHYERAVVVTFNYDLLVETAIDQATLVDYQSPYSSSTILGIDLVVPSPTREPGQTWASLGGQRFTDNSFQIAKLHGSLNWYRSRDSGWDATSISMFNRVMLGYSPTQRIKQRHPDLEQLITPPVADKTSYYNSNLTSALWSSARGHLENASRLTLIGYSLPPEDTASVELTHLLHEDASIEIVDFNPGQVKDPRSLAGRIAAIRKNCKIEHTGASSVESYALAARTALEQCTLERIRDLGDTHLPSAPLVVFSVDGWPGVPSTYAEKNLAFKFDTLYKRMGTYILSAQDPTQWTDLVHLDKFSTLLDSNGQIQVKLGESVYSLGILGISEVAQTITYPFVVLHLSNVTLVGIPQLVPADSEVMPLQTATQSK